MVLHDVAQCAHLLVELAASLDAERFGHRDLHRVDVVVVPHRLEQRVREAEDEQVLDRLLPEEVVDAVDRVLVEGMMQDRVELFGRLEVAPERLLDDDTSVFVDALRGEALRDVVEQARRDREEVQRVLAGLERLLELLERRLLAVVARDVPQALQHVLDHVLVGSRLDGGDGFAEPLLEAQKAPLYRELIAAAEATRAELQAAAAGLAAITGTAAERWRVAVDHYLPLIARIIAQSERRVLATRRCRPARSSSACSSRTPTSSARAAVRFSTVTSSTWPPARAA